MRFIKSYTNDAAIQAAVDDKSLGKPYVALDENTGKIDWNGKDIDYSKMYLTIEALSGGTFYVRKPNIDYSVNGGEWETTTGATELSLNQGDEVRFKGSITAGGQIRGLFSGNTLATVVYGNPLSLEHYNFPRKNIPFQMIEMFLNNTGLVDASHLDFSGIRITDYSFQNTFYGCTSLTKAPTLPFSDIPGNSSCAYMFYGCSSLKYIKCLAASTPNPGGMENWVKNVSTTGTFVKKAGVTWPTGNSGIPSGWTVIEE